MKTRPLATDWIWALHANSHDFRSQTSDVGIISSRIFASHLGHISLVFAWVSGMHIAGSRYSNYLSWLEDPQRVLCGAQAIPASVPGLPWISQDAVNGDVGGGFSSLQITSGLYYVWRIQGYSSTSQLFAAGIASLVLSGLCFYGGWFHYHAGRPSLEWFADINSAMNHHLAGFFGLGSLGWGAHLLHVSLPTALLLDGGADPRLLPSPQEL